MDSIYLAGGTLLLGIIAYLLWKRQFRRSHRKREAGPSKPVSGYDPGSDSFYCIFCEDGTTRSGNIPADR